MTTSSDDLSLFLISTIVEVPVVAENESEAKNVLYDNYSQIIYDLTGSSSDALEHVEIVSIDAVESLSQDSRWRGYTPHGDYYGEQYSCEYYTLVEKHKRKKENEEAINKIQSLLKGLTTEELQILENYFINI